MYISAPNRSLIHRLRIRIKKVYFRNSTNSPFISGDSIAECTDYIVFGKSKNDPLNVSKLRQSESIFVPGEKLHSLLNTNFDDVRCTTLVTGNSDQNFTEMICLPKSIKLWISQNNSIEDEIICPLPIGLENKRLGRSGFEKLHQPPRKHAILNKILLPPMSPTNPIRNEVLEWATIHQEIFVVKSQYMSTKSYFKLTKKFKFIFCCEGNGFENLRIWESLYQNSFPVMLETEWSKKLRILGLPILFVEKLDDLNHSLLEKFYHDHRNFDCYKTEILWIPFWKKLINNPQEFSNIKNI